MAGAGYKLFTTGQVLTAAEVNTYLQEQTVMVFNDAASRTTALSGVLAEGMVSYLKSTKVVEIYNGTAWASLDDPNAIQNTIVDAKGDLIAATGNDVPARLAVGNNGETLLADSSTSTGLRYQASQAAGKNAIINGGFDIWQRATSSTTTSGYVAADRWTVFAGGSVTWARESTTVPAGSTYSMKITAGASIQPIIYQAIETLNAIQFAGKNVTLSLLAQASTNTNITFDIQWSSAVDNPAGGSWTTITPTSGGSGTATTSGFTQLSGVFAIPSTAKSLFVRVYTSGNIASGVIVYYGQIQLELGSVATAFTRAGGTLAGELQAAQRYYYRNTGSGAFSTFGQGAAPSTTSAAIQIPLLVTMRTTPTVVDFANLRLDDGVNGYAVTSATTSTTTSSTSLITATCNVASGLTQYRTYNLSCNNNSAGYVGFSAEL